MDGEDIMLDIYDNVQEELKVKAKLLEKEKEQVYFIACVQMKPTLLNTILCKLACQHDSIKILVMI